MLLIRQRGLNDCGIAVAAMLTGVRYEAVFDRFITGLCAGFTLSPLVMWRALEDITQAAWQIDELWQPWPLVGAYPFESTPMAVLLQRPCSSRHYIAILGNQAYDPLFQMPFPRNEYPDKNASIITLFRPKKAIQYPYFIPSTLVR
jgi:hypothetical protein